jgi:hypothetical protein
MKGNSRCSEGPLPQSPLMVACRPAEPGDWAITFLQKLILGQFLVLEKIRTNNNEEDEF